MAGIEEIINLETLTQFFDELCAEGKMPQVMEEIIRQSRTEFNYVEESAGGD